MTIMTDDNNDENDHDDGDNYHKMKDSKNNVLLSILINNYSS